MKRDDESALHQRLILGFIVNGHKSIPVVDEEGYKTMMRGLTKRPSSQIPCRRKMRILLARPWQGIKGPVGSPRGVPYLWRLHIMKWTGCAGRDGALDQQGLEARLCVL